MNERLLHGIGLTEGEIKVYLALLKLGETTTGKVIKEAQISSGKIYEILYKLIDKGLASYIIKEKTRHFTAASPNRIFDYLHEKGRKLKDKEEKLRKELPSLILMQDAVKKGHETRLFRGIKGIRTAIFEALQELSEGDEVLAMGIMSSKKEIYNLLWKNWHKERIKKKIICKALFSDRGSKYYNYFKRIKFTEVRVIKGITPSAIDVMGDNVLIFTYEKGPSVLSISNPEVARSFTSFFNNMWDNSENKE